MSGTIKSDTLTASAAISELSGIDASQMQDKKVALTDTSGIAGIANGQQVTNQLLHAIGDFTQAVLVQANKFPAIAAKIEKVDVEEAKRWGD